MRRSSVAAIALTLALAGCPLPQPLPTYPAGTITPPRILAATTTSTPATGSGVIAVSGTQSIIPVPAGCAQPPTYALDATIFYQESVAVEARWFTDYRTDVAQRYAIQQSSQVPPNPDATILDRPVPTYAFQPYGFAVPAELGISSAPNAAGVVHVVELVVSNGFDTSDPRTQPEPNRTPGSTADGTSKFEIQTYRWVFVNVPPSATACIPNDAGCPCPP